MKKYYRIQQQGEGSSIEFLVERWSWVWCAWRTLAIKKTQKEALKYIETYPPKTVYKVSK